MSRVQTYLLFTVSARPCAVAVQEIREVLHLALLSRPPGIPASIEGFLTLGGSVRPVIRIDQLFALLPAPIGIYTPLLLPRHEDPPVAYLVSSVEGFSEFADDALLPVREAESWNGCVAAQFDHLGTARAVLSLARILSESERLRVAELQSMEEQRRLRLEESCR